ncbi:MAG TPA: nucleotidyl transferase AbiEii/AbiGii toxin family protein [bacterium]|nr:nucleotidyl transferase AbiEii/AbiGii toxin family protein [bacterium]HQL61531.1 nucleotidyl transferase AbiEii/AbiGii toxin family protein [bacterium]
MTGKEFLNSLANGKSDILQELLVILTETESRYCVIGGLAVNAYVEPVVSLDVDIVIAADNIESVTIAARKHEWKIERFENSINIGSPGSDLRIQIQTDPRYQGFLANAESGNILGYTMKVAALEDLLQGKVWAWMDQTRRRSKRQKDLADILRLLEAFPKLEAKLPQSLKEQLLEE